MSTHPSGIADIGPIQRRPPRRPWDEGAPIGYLRQVEAALAAQCRGFEAGWGFVPPDLEADRRWFRAAIRDELEREDP